MQSQQGSYGRVQWDSARKTTDLFDTTYKAFFMATVRFEHARPERLVPKTSALDHSVTLPRWPILSEIAQLPFYGL